jgi:predicted nucleotidyltransferase
VAKRAELKQALAGKDSYETSVVVFGSLARDEFTDGSDIDWTLLIDGYADPQHLNVAREIRALVQLLLLLLYFLAAKSCP